jgi:nitroreductase
MPGELHHVSAKEAALNAADVEYIVSAATLAPSAHNTQPWKFRAAGSRLDIFVDWSRHLTVSDSTGRQLYVSLGCAFANAIAAARQRGYRVAVTPFPEGIDKQQPAARLEFAGQTMPPELADRKMFDAIAQRRTDRSLYDGQPLTANERQQLRLAAGVILVEDRAVIETVAKLTEEATATTLSRKDFKVELSRWVRNSWTRQADGMPGYAMGIPAPVSRLAPMMVRLAPIHKQEAPKTRQETSSASGIAVITSAHDTPSDWFAAGQALENLWLSATATGLAAMPLVAAIEAGENIRTRLQSAVHTDQLPQSILRLGHSRQKALRPTPRRSAQDCFVS